MAWVKPLSFDRLQAAPCVYTFAEPSAFMKRFVCTCPTARILHHGKRLGTVLRDDIVHLLADLAER